MTIQSQRDAKWADLWARAQQAASEARKPFAGQPWRQYAVTYATIRPATCSFVRYLCKHDIGHLGTYGGWDVGFWSGDAEECRAHIDAMLQVFTDAGLKVDSYWELV